SQDLGRRLLDRARRWRRWHCGQFVRACATCHRGHERRGQQHAKWSQHGSLHLKSTGRASSACCRARSRWGGDSTPQLASAEPAPAFAADLAAPPFNFLSAARGMATFSTGASFTVPGGGGEGTDGKSREPEQPTIASPRAGNANRTRSLPPMEISNG